MVPNKGHLGSKLRVLEADCQERLWALERTHVGLCNKHIWVVVKIKVPFLGYLNNIGAVFFIGTQKGTIIFDNHPHGLWEEAPWHVRLRLAQRQQWRNPCQIVWVCPRCAGFKHRR